MRCLYQQSDGSAPMSAEVTIERGCARVKARGKRGLYSVTEEDERNIKAGKYVLLYGGGMVKSMDVPIA
jgi:hypothetical protein